MQTFGADSLHEQLQAFSSPLAMLEEICRHAPVGLQLFSRDGRSVLVNPMHARLFGARPPPQYNVLHDPVLAQQGVLPLVRRAFDGERVTVPPIWYDARGGADLPRLAVGAELVPLRTGGGDAVTHVLFVFSDMTETQQVREQAEVAARRSAFLAEATRLLSAASLDLDGTLRQLAQLAAPALADYCTVDIVDEDSGRPQRVAAAHADPLGQLLMEELMAYPPEAGSPQPAGRVLASGRPELLETVPAEVIRSHTVDAKHAALMQRVGVRSHLAVPMFDSEGRTLGVISLGYVGARRYGPQDVPYAQALASHAAVAIHNARLHQRALRSETRFRLMADSMAHIVWIVGGNSQIEYFNREWVRYTGLEWSPRTPEEALSVVHPDDMAAVQTQFLRSAREGGTLLVEHRLRASDGQYRWFLARAMPEIDPATRRVLRWYGASIDIHDLKTAEGALRESDRRKDEFLAMLAHELRNPLAAIASTWWLLKARAGSQPELARSLEVLGRQTQRLTAMVNDLLDVSRVTRGLIMLRPERIELTEIAERALESVRGFLDERGHTLELHPAGEPLPVHGDPARLEQTLVNIMANAAKYTDHGGRIELTLAREGAQARIDVRDNGIGIAPEFIGHIFDLFAQAERGLSRSQGGLGIGLTIVRRLVELHGGSIEASSAGLGRGSTFTLRLPLALR